MQASIQNLKDLRKFTKPASISPHLKCSICTDVFMNPIRLLCSYIYIFHLKGTHFVKIVSTNGKERIFPALNVAKTSISDIKGRI
jgi:hypothetical protein